MSVEDRAFQLAIASRLPATRAGLELALRTVQRMISAGYSSGQALHQAAAAHYIPLPALARAWRLLQDELARRSPRPSRPSRGPR